MNSKSAKTILFLVATFFCHSNVNSQSNVLQTNVSDNTNQQNHDNSTDRRYTSLGYFSESVEETDADRIVGGQYAREGQFPFMAVVHRLMGGGRVAQCGGTIISSRWVLTAGHCVANAPRRFFVVFGIVDKSGIGYNFYRGAGVSMMTTEGALHPQYRQTANDIGLLHMPRDIPFNRIIRPIQLATRPRENFNGKNVIVIGWGKDGYIATGTKGLKYAVLPVISNGECSRYWGVTSKHVCTAAGLGQDACQGDSGGPLILIENGRAIQIGIVSYGDKNCPSNKPGVFTKVSGYMDWIQSVTGIRF